MKKSYICFCSVNGRARNLYIFQKMNHGIYICRTCVVFFADDNCAGGLWLFLFFLFFCFVKKMFHLDT